jgi:hypothetical protein
MLGTVEQLLAFFLQLRQLGSKSDQFGESFPPGDQCVT